VENRPTGGLLGQREEDHGIAARDLAGEDAVGMLVEKMAEIAAAPATCGIGPQLDLDLHESLSSLGIPSNSRRMPDRFPAFSSSL
jgi:hypothetical protein